MLWLLVRRELLEHAMSFRFGAVFVLAALLATTGALVFAGQYQTAQREYRERVEGVCGEDGTTDLQGIACSGGLHVVRRPSPLAFCSGAGEGELPNWAQLAVHRLGSIGRAGQPEALLDDPVRVDWAFVVGVLLSFAAGLLTYRSVAGEQQEGTLLLVLSNPVSRASVLLGKYLAALLTLGVSLAAAMVLGLLVLRLTVTLPLGAAEWARIAFFAAAALAYLSCFALIGLLCSVVSRNATLAAVGFLFAWTVAVFALFMRQDVTPGGAR
ncbi:MAG: ABC transporter permease [Candidatus Latescibacterota bacterium]